MNSIITFRAFPKSQNNLSLQKDDWQLQVDENVCSSVKILAIKYYAMQDFFAKTDYQKGM